MYRPLPDALATAHAAGLLTMMTTDAMLLSTHRIDEIGPLLDLVSSIVDGIARVTQPRCATHGRLHHDGRRARATPHRRIRFGVIFTLTQYNLDELDPSRASRPMRARRWCRCTRSKPWGTRRRSWEKATRPARARLRPVGMARLRAELGIQSTSSTAIRSIELRAAPSRCLGARPGSVGPARFVAEPARRRDDGRVVPLVYDFDDAFALGYLHENATYASWRTRDLDDDRRRARRARPVRRGAHGSSPRPRVRRSGRPGARVPRRDVRHGRHRGTRPWAARDRHGGRRGAGGAGTRAGRQRPACWCRPATRPRWPRPCAAGSSDAELRRHLRERAPAAPGDAAPAGRRRAAAPRRPAGTQAVPA